MTICGMSAFEVAIGGFAVALGRKADIAYCGAYVRL
jgi:hypothetical protein